METKLIDKVYYDNGGTYCVRGSEKEVMYNWIKELQDVKRVVDVGCGNGFFSYFLAKEFPQFEVVGIDSDADYIKYADENFKADNLKFIETDIEGLGKLGLGQFDLVILSEVIEHLPNVNVIMQNINNIMKLDGVMIVSTDNLYSTIIHSLKRYVIFKKEIKYEQWYHQEEYPDREWPWAHHLYSFSLETLATSLKIAGYETERYAYSNHQKSMLGTMLPILRAKIIIQVRKK